MRLLLSTLPLLLLLQAEGRPNAFAKGVPSVKGVLAQKAFAILRGGSDDDDDEIDELIDELIEDLDTDDEEEDDEEEEEEEELDPKLTKAAIKSTSKAKTKKTTVTKKKVSATLKSKSSTPSKSAPLKATPVSKPKKKSRSLMKALKVPYILRACMNPFTVFAMTRAYFASLFNFNYLKEDNTQNLRSAMEEKAKKSGGNTGRKKGKRQMRPGQAKTLSDLPQLSA